MFLIGAWKGPEPSTRLAFTRLHAARPPFRCHAPRATVTGERETTPRTQLHDETNNGGSDVIRLARPSRSLASPSLSSVPPP